MFFLLSKSIQKICHLNARCKISGKSLIISCSSTAKNLHFVDVNIRWNFRPSNSLTDYRQNNAIPRHVRQILRRTKKLLEILGSIDPLKNWEKILIFFEKNLGSDEIFRRNSEADRVSKDSIGLLNFTRSRAFRVSFCENLTL